MARIFNTNETAASVTVRGKTIQLGAREGWDGPLSASDAATARKVEGIEVSGETITPAKPKRKR